MKKTISSLLVVVFVLTMVLSMGVLTGCTNEDESSDKTAGGESSGVVDSGDLEHVNLTWYYIGSEQSGEEEVFAAANEIIEKEINATVEFIRLGWGEYEDKMQLKIAAGEEFDLCFSAEWINNYKTNVENGAFMILDDLIPEYAPETYATIPRNITDGTRINGHLYGFPGYQVCFRQAALIFNKELVDKYDLKDEIFAIKTLDDLTPILEVVKANEPDYIMTDLTMAYDMFYPFTEENYLSNVLGGDACVYLRGDGQVKSSLDEEVYQLDLENYQRAVEWYKAGYFHPDAGMGLQSDFSEERAAGKFFVINDVNKPGVEADMFNRYGYEVYAVPMGASTISTGSITSNMTVVSATSENPERAVMLLELMNTNADLYNIIVFGLEGKQYEMTGEDRIEVIDADSYSGMAWMMGNQFNAYKLPGQADDVWEVTMQLNEAASSAPDLGFYFEDDNVRTELANVNAVYTEYKSILYYGLVEDIESVLNERNEKLEKAGLQKVIDEMQAQYDAWKNN